MHLTNRVAIVTGSGQGIGRAIALALAHEGAKVVTNSRKPGTTGGDAATTAEAIKSAGGQAVPFFGDIASFDEARRLVKMAVDQFGRVDILVNNAGVCRDSLFIDLDEATWDLVNNVNAKGVYLVTRAVLPHMMAARYGKIVNISSRSGKEGLVGLSHYAASKFAVIGLTQSLAREMGPYNINVNAICPGILRTAIYESLLDARAQRQHIERETVWSNVVKQTPLGRPQEPEDIANLVLFLSSDVSCNITGEAINLNGGIRVD